MKIILLDNFPKDLNKPFAGYRYDEILAHMDGNINIREILAEKSDDWLNDINKSFADLSRRFQKRTRWWWVTGASRIDLRPWGQEDVFKPLFFARAVLYWLSKHPGTDEIFLVCAPKEVEIYIKEFKADIVIENRQSELIAIPFIITLFEHLMIGILKSFKNAGHIIWNHLFCKRGVLKSKLLVLYELISDMTLVEGHKYFYDGLFEEVGAEAEGVVFGCIDNPSSPVNKLRSQLNEEIFFLLDYITFIGFIKSIGINIYVLVLLFWDCLWRKEYTFGNFVTSRFWPNYLLKELSLVPFLNNICCYYALNVVLDGHKYERLVYTYEEKASERAILFSSREKNIKTTGYIPHPQHRLALSMRDAYEPYAPKPDAYAVCGDQYVDYLRTWCKKESAAISVWGSKKSFREDFQAQKYDRTNLKVLLTLSHPNELGVFCSWLERDKKLTQGVTYYLRFYKEAGFKRFQEQLNVITKKFDCVKEIEGSLKENFEFCDLTVFCATSAGLLGVNGGKIAIHLCLDDFFAINPCFDDTEFMLSCRTAEDFSNRLDALCSLDDSAISEIYRNELDFISTIFHPIQKQSIAGVET